MLSATFSRTSMSISGSRLPMRDQTASYRHGRSEIVQETISPLMRGGTRCQISPQLDSEFGLTASVPFSPNHLGSRVMMARPTESARCAGWPTARNHTQRGHVVMPYRIRNHHSGGQNTTGIKAGDQSGSESMG